MAECTFFFCRNSLNSLIYNVNPSLFTNFAVQFKRNRMLLKLYHRYVSLFLVLMCFVPHSLNAQVRGRVTDADTGEPIPAVNVYYGKQKTVGTTKAGIHCKHRIKGTPLCFLMSVTRHIRYI